MMLVGNGLLITRGEYQPLIADGCVAINGHLIVEIGPTAELQKKYPESTFIDARGRVIMPGMINTHMHLYSTFARGMALKDAPPQNFGQILERLWWRLDKVLSTEDVYYSALLPLIDCIKNGTTTIFDHHASPGAVRESLFTLEKAAKLTGVRSCLCYEVSDRDGEKVMQEGIRENVEFMQHANKGEDEMIRGMFGLHASLTLSDRTLDQCNQALQGLEGGYHIHVAEGVEDLQDSLSKYGKRVVERLNSFGILGPKSIAAHCVHVDEAERQILQETAVNVVHNPESNMGNAVGCAPILSMLEQDIPVGLGTDGYTCDMFESYKVANILHKHQQGHPSVAWAEAPKMLFENNPLISRAYFPHPLGKLVPGAYADVIIVDYIPPTTLDQNNIDGHILFGMSGRAVDTTIINGKVLMEDRVLKGIDEAEIYAKARELSRKVWERF